MSQTTTCDVIIIGGGSAALEAAMLHLAGDPALRARLGAAAAARAATWTWQRTSEIARTAIVRLAADAATR